MAVKCFKTVVYQRLFAGVVLTLIVAGTLLFRSIPAKAAESGTCGSSAFWVFDGNTLTISGSGEMTNFSDGNMPPWYPYAKNITSVFVGEGITTIGELAFYECKSLTHVILPSTLSEIGIRSFKDCVSLSYLNLPSSLYVIAESAFENCASLNGIRLSEGMRIISDKAFYRCASLTSVTVPASIEYLGMVVFAYCENLLRADIRCSIEKLPDWTFYGCSSLLTVSLPSTINEVGALSFYNCEMLSNIHYDGEKLDEIFESILEDTPTISSRGGITRDEIPPTAGAVSEDVSEDGKTITSVVTGVSETSNAIISVQETIEYVQHQGTSPVDPTTPTNPSDPTHSTDPSNPTNPSSTEPVNPNPTAPVWYDSTVVGVHISATIDNEDGWNEVMEMIEDTIDEGEKSEEGLTIDLQITETSVPGEWLDMFAGKDIEVTMTTPDGSSWAVNLKDSEPDQIQERSYDLQYHVTSVDQPVKGIESSEVYQVKFSDDIDFNIQIRSALGSANQNRTATLYQKIGNTAEAVQSSLVDNEGRAWFSVANVDKDVEYYVAMDVENVPKNEVIIPKSMNNQYPGLSDIYGTKYEITGRKSKWGITGGQFAMYAGIVVGFMILIVTVIMITRNHFQKVKAEKARQKREAEETIDRDELYEEVLRDLLAEQKQKSKE